MPFLWSAGLVIFIVGIQSIFFVPLTIWYGIWKRRFFARFSVPATPSVSVVIPAYNEERMIARCLESVCASVYPDFEVIVVNDGSTDATEQRVQPFLSDPRIRYVRKVNGGKGSALNSGIAASNREIILYTDADCLFQTDTIGKITRWFVDPSIHAVCGDDTPLSPETALQKLLVITTHIGTGFVRRALSILGVIPIISGNLGAVRRETLERVGGFSNVWGEDLDITFRLQKAKARIVYDWEAAVRCDVPRNFRSLWKQRVRWTRSYLKLTAVHRDIFFRPSYAPFSFYMPLNWFSMVVLPILQMVLIGALPLAMARGLVHFGGILDLLSFSGLGMFAGIAVYSVMIDRRPEHLPLIPLYGWLVLPFSFFLDGVVLYSLAQEMGQEREIWHKTERRDPGTSTELPRRLVPAFASRGISRVAMVALALVAFLILPGQQPSSPAPAGASSTALTVATHFDAWSKPDDAISSVLDRPESRMVQTIAVGAGRLEWTFFRRQGYEKYWSNDQKGSSEDLLQMAIQRASSSGKKVVAVVDFFAPAYIAAHPGAEGVDADGKQSIEQVCFMELVRGRYGAELKEMIASLVGSYSIEGISLTELDYRRFCYDGRCLASFRALTGMDDWPRISHAQEIDKDDRRIGEWRSHLMAEYLRSIADIAHAARKRILIDVPVDFKDMEAEGLQHGLHYPSLLQFADALVVWDYFYLDSRSPSSSKELARFFTGRYGAERVVMSIGLWGKERPVTANEFGLALRGSLEGGATHVWITPNHMIGSDHWRQLAGIMAMQISRPAN